MKRMDSGLRTVDPFTISLFIFVMVLVSFLVLIALTDDPVRRAMLISASLVSITIMVCFSMMLLRRRMDSRTETLVFVRRCATLSRFVYAERMVESYRHRHAITDRWEGVDSPLISRKEWIPHSLIRLGDVFELNSSFEYINGYRVAGNGEKDPKDTVLVERDMRALLPRPDRYLSYNNKMFLKKNSFDDELFIIKSIEGDCNHGKIRMDVRYTSYDHYIDTCEFLMLRDVHHMEEGIDGDLTIDLENYNNRAAGIGVCTLTILRLSDGKDYMLIHHRSDKLGEAPGVISLVPAGSFSPSGDEEYGVRASQGHDDAKTPRIIDTIFREFEEEILGSENVEFATDYERLGIFHDDNVYYLGMGFDPLTTKMEFITALTLNWDLDTCTTVVNDCRSRGYEVDDPKALMTIDGVRRFLDTICSHEGTIRLVEFSRRNVSSYYQNRQCMPVFRACMRSMMNDDYRIFNSLHR